MRLILLVFALPQLAGFDACEQPAPAQQEFSVRVRAVNPEGEPLAGLEIGVAGDRLGATSATGALSLRMFGVEGEQIALDAVCPVGFSGPRESAVLTLRSFQSVDPQAAPQTEITLTCSPDQRLTAVAIRTGQPSIPIRMRGEELARTNEAGTAHVVLAQDSGSAFQLTLDTAERKQLRPESPTRMFAVGDRDDIVVWDQPFVVLEPRPPAARRRIVKPRPPPPPPPPAPYRLD